MCVFLINVAPSSTVVAPPCSHGSRRVSKDLGLELLLPLITSIFNRFSWGRKNKGGIEEY
ncbi:hypothetical protein V2J09_021118 [Rumex salicifolius]